MPAAKLPSPAVQSDLATALASCRGAFAGIGLFSGMINILSLTGSFFMLEVYDRVLPSRSVPTLVGLAVLVAILFSFQGILDLIRGRILVRVGAALDEALSGRVYDTVVRLPLKVGNRNDGLQSLRDLDNIRSFLSSLGPTALFDLPWMPLYLGICFVFHFWIGMTALCGALILIGLTFLTELRTRGPIKAASNLGMSRNGLAETSRRNAEVLTAMGMSDRLRHRWSEANRKYMASQQQASDEAGGLGAVVKTLRLVLQSAVLGVGAYLVIHQESTAGVIIAGSILSARALAPVDLAIGNWKGFIAARQSWDRLNKLLALIPAREAPMPLPRPTNNITVEKASVTPPGQQKLAVQDVSFALKSGDGLGVIGPSASGKSSLARMLVGVWQPVRGKVTLDGATFDQWALENIGRDIGYLPQDVELIAGTVAQNISRFDPNADSSAIIAAAQAAGVHELILGLPGGYDADIGEQGMALSAGQQQRIALARALYGDPFLVVLDEPNSNLDSDGELALTQAIHTVRSRGGIAIVIAHRPSALAAVDHVLVMHQGRVQAFGPKDDVLAKVLRPSPPLKIVTDTGRGSS
jgi:PrtD family type I secretion system ABC transporter